MASRPVCPAHARDPISDAMNQCPFMKAVCEAEGKAYARRIALNPFAAAPGSQPIFPEDVQGSFNAVVQLFHGDKGVVPLPQFSQSQDTKGCPFQTCPGAELASASEKRSEKIAPHPLAGAPMASISLSGPFGFLPDPSDFFRRNRKPSKSQNHKKPKSTRSGASAPNNGSPTNGNAAASAPSGSTPSNNNNGGACPMRRFMGPMTALLPVAASNGRLQCPPAIVAMRAAVAALKPVRDLRPKALPIRSLALAGTTIIANLPCGMWREHTKKFSPEWFIAVHATIPFVAMLRKAVLMPKWAMLLTLAGAVAGQQTGAALERKRRGGGHYRSSLAPTKSTSISSISSSDSKDSRGGFSSARGQGKKTSRSERIGACGMDLAQSLQMFQFASMNGGAAQRVKAA